LASRELASFSLNNSLGKDFCPYGVNKDLIYNWSLEDFSDNVLSFLYVGSEGLLFCDNRNVPFFDQGGVLLVNDGLMVLMDVFFVNNGLVVLDDHVLMMFMKNIFLVFNKDVFVMFVNDVLMNFLNDGCISDLISSSLHFRI
jgi:hypothetical protein